MEAQPAPSRMLFPTLQEKNKKEQHHEHSLGERMKIRILPIMCKEIFTAKGDLDETSNSLKYTEGKMTTDTSVLVLQATAV